MIQRVISEMVQDKESEILQKWFPLQLSIAAFAFENKFNRIRASKERIHIVLFNDIILAKQSSYARDTAIQCLAKLLEEDSTRKDIILRPEFIEFCATILELIPSEERFLGDYCLFLGNSMRDDLFIGKCIGKNSKILTSLVMMILRTKNDPSMIPLTKNLEVII